MKALAATGPERFRALVAQRLGLRHDDALGELTNLLEHRMAALGCTSVDGYLRRLDADRDELAAVAAQLTVGETYFLRYADHWRALVETVLPERLHARRDQRQLRIVSAGCASGEEAYSIALLLRDARFDLTGWRIQIIGLDVNRVHLAKARQARYSAWSLRATPASVRARYFTANGRDFDLDPAIRSMVTFEERNLVADDPLYWQALDCDVVFCRNVLMYLHPASMQRVVGHLTRALTPGGYLFLGHAESLRGPTRDHELCHTHDAFYYRRRSAVPPALAPAGAPSQDEAPAAAAVTAGRDLTHSWVDVIRDASDRVTALTTSPNRSRRRRRRWR